MLNYMSVSCIHSWGKISMNFDIWDKSRGKNDQQQGRKQVRCPVSCWFFKCFISNITEILNPAELGFEDEKLQMPQNTWQKCGICCQLYIPMFITFSSKKGGKKASSFWENSGVRKSLSPTHTLVSLWAFCHHAHIVHLCRDSLSPFPGTAAQGARPRLRIIPGRRFRKRQIGLWRKEVLFISTNNTFGEKTAASDGLVNKLLVTVTQ